MSFYISVSLFMCLSKFENIFLHRKKTLISLFLVISHLVFLLKGIFFQEKYLFYGKLVRDIVFEHIS